MLANTEGSRLDRVKYRYSSIIGACGSELDAYSCDILLKTVRLHGIQIDDHMLHVVGNYSQLSTGNTLISNDEQSEYT